MMRKCDTAIVAVAVVCGLTACKDDDKKAPAKPSAPTGAGDAGETKATTDGGPAEEHSDAKAAMQKHFAAAAAARDAIVVGDLDVARTSFRFLADHGGESDIPEAWQPTTTLLQEVAARALEHTTLEAVAMRVGEITTHCGGCHAAQNAELQFSTVPVPRADGSYQEHMQLHRWAMDRLWEGAVGPSNSAWRKGAKALSDAPLHLRDLSEDTDKRIALSEKVHDIARRAIKTPAGPGRGKLVGELLATCASCHQIARR